MTVIPPAPEIPPLIVPFRGVNTEEVANQSRMPMVALPGKNDRARVIAATAVFEAQCPGTDGDSVGEVYGGTSLQGKLTAAVDGKRHTGWNGVLHAVFKGGVGNRDAAAIGIRMVEAKIAGSGSAAGDS